jgi:hypothetical protein
MKSFDECNKKPGFDLATHKHQISSVAGGDDTTWPEMSKNTENVEFIRPLVTAPHRGYVGAHHQVLLF